MICSVMADDETQQTGCFVNTTKLQINNSRVKAFEDQSL